MERTEHKLTLDVHKTVSTTSVSVKKGDTAHRLLITLSEGGYPYHIGEDCTAVFSAVKPDGTTIWNDCTIDNDVVIYDFTEQTTAALGVTNCEIQIYDPYGALLTSASFLLLVEDGASNRSAVVSSDEFGQLRDMFETANWESNRAHLAANRAYTAAEACMVIGRAGGETIRLDDAIDAEFVGMRIFGKTTQNGTPTPANPATLVSVGSLGSIGLTSNEQTITIPVSGGLPGIPVASGGNYTDANGQQWICDEIDLGRGKYRQRIIRFSGISFAVADNNGYPVGDSLMFRKGYSAELGDTAIRHREALCNKLPYNNSSLNNDVNGFYFSFGTLYARIKGVSDAATFNAMMSGAEVITFLDHVIETDLPDEVLDAYADYIRSYSGDTVVSNDSGAHMALEYLMDARKYIDKMISTGIHEATLE